MITTNDLRRRYEAARNAYTTLKHQQELLSRKIVDNNLLSKILQPQLDAVESEMWMWKNIADAMHTELKSRKAA